LRRRGGFDKGFLLLLVIILILVGTGIFLYAQVRTDKITELVKKGGPFTVAFFVTDRTHLVKWREVAQSSIGGPDGAAPPVSSAADGGSNGARSSTTPVASDASNSTALATATGGTPPISAVSNTLLFTELFSYDPKTQKGALLDIPGNVGSLIGSIQKIDRIDVLFKPGKEDAYRAKIASLIGSSVPLYIETDITDIPKIVDLLGGLNLFIANPVQQTDTNPMVLLPSGSITLDGSKVESYLSFKRPSDSEIEVISRRQRFVQSLLKAIGTHSALFDEGGVYTAFRSWVSTDMNRRSLLSFIGLMSKLDAEKIVFQRVLGVDRAVDGQQLLFPHYDGRLLRETVQQTLTSLANPQTASDQSLNARLQILNGTQVTGLAHRTSQIFQSFGYDVVSVGNADRQDYAHTEILDRSGNISQAQKVASIIKCTQIASQPVAPSVSTLANAAQKSGGGQPIQLETSYDVTIILGKDFDGRYCK